MDKKQLAVITSTRAEYGLLRPVLQKLAASSCLEPVLLVTGAHLSPRYGETVREIETDPLAPPIAERLPILAEGETTAQTVARTLAAFTACFARRRPDAVLVLGDRYEIFAAAAAAALACLPIAHISGGDVTAGAADDWYRHCITKMACLHFPSCAAYARRLVRMGEAPQTVHLVGGLGDENIRSMPKLSRKKLAASVGLDLSGRYGLVTYHPETAPGAPDPEAQMRQFLAALETAGRAHGVKWLLTGANADAGGEAINALARNWAAAHPGQAAFFASLGVQRYLSAMQYAAVVAGNSSSGVVETPSFGVPAVNVGRRQAGRIRCQNVLCCGAAQAEVEAALATALSPGFLQQARAVKSPYNGGDTSGRIVSALEQALFAPGFGAPKGFYDGPVPPEWQQAAEQQAETV